jgi:anti-anti-sigma factor
MALDIQLDDQPRGTVITLVGQLDTDTAHEMAPVIDGLRQSPPRVLILALQDLTYISSAGLRCVFQMKKLMKEQDGRLVISEPSPQVRKVFEIVQAVPIKSVFSSVAELDEYLDRMQKQVGKDI